MIAQPESDLRSLEVKIKRTKSAAKRTSYLENSRSKSLIKEREVEIAQETVNANFQEDKVDMHRVMYTPHNIKSLKKALQQGISEA